MKTYVPSGSENVDAKKVLLWDRKTEGGFPGNQFKRQLLTTRLIVYRNKSAETAGERPHRSEPGFGALGQAWQEESSEHRD
jgi:predicted Rdx family selenoprotein